ncbi:TnsA-like heteromeric transposase endonuclease subunit [Microbacterium sp. NPDC090225]|uniref:TnsA-like heteromeric transposase endonuclease subunit n=1 Tax=Microbacterium sp. NPDC090225 TaxID=3364207 RepID=UPI0038082586
MSKLKGSIARGGDGVERIAWYGAKERPQHTRVSNVQRLYEMAPTRRARKAPKYTGQLSYQGHYWFAGVQQLIWHESMLEHTGLMLIDHLREVRSVTAQPFLIQFADGTTHVPDYLVLGRDGTRSIFDMHLRALTSEADERAFAATERVCDSLGWEHIVMDQLADVTAWNLEMLARYRHPMFEPDVDVQDKILALARETRRFGDLRRALATDKPGELIPAITHLMWRRELVFDIEKPFTDLTLITAI